MSNVFDVADYILKECGEIPALKLQKLVYYSQVWSLVWDDAPLFSEEIEAWANGPVVRSLYARHRQSYFAFRDQLGDANYQSLSNTQRETVDAVLHFYGDKPSQWLSDLTHMEDPWIDARKGLNPGERGSKVITQAAMAEYYSGLSPE